MADTCTAGWTPTIGEYPYPPKNVTVVHSFMAGCLDIRWDDPSALNMGPSGAATTEATTVTVNGAPDLLTYASATVTVQTSPISAGSTLTIGDQVLTAVNGAPGTDQFDGSLGTTDLIAASIADAVNNGSVSGWKIATATVVGAVVTLTSQLGTEGNDIALESSTGSLVLSGTTFSGGLDAATLTIGGTTLTANTTRTVGGLDFQVGPSNFDTAQSIAEAIADPANGFTTFVEATYSGDVVTLTATPDSVGSVSVQTNSDVLVLSNPGAVLAACSGPSNLEWTVLGVNIYRSDTGERGPYFRVNKFPVGTGFFRDCTDNVLVQEELVDWNTGWSSRGDAANNRLWRICTRRRPIVKSEGQAIPASSPSDVTVSIDGVVVQVDRVWGSDGFIDLINTPTYDPSTETTIPPVLPNVDGSSVVLVTYHRQGNLVKTDLETKAKIHYRVTTVAVDPNNITPSGLVETPLGYAEPVSPVQREKLDYMWREAIRRNRWILEQGGERVKLFIRRVTGTKCPCQWDATQFEFAKQPLNNCEQCFGTGFLGGYEGPIDLIIAPDDAERAVRQTPIGRRLEHTYEVWTGPTPLLSQRDFIVKQNGERYSVGPTRRTQVRGVVLQQSFQIGFLDECDIRYKVPLYGLEQLAWPQTRYTRPEEAPCEDSEPFPVGFDYQGAPMASETASVPDGREQRGRTPVWQNITYGGKG